MNWDLVMMAGQAFLTLFLLPTALAFDLTFYRTRWPSGYVRYIEFKINRKKNVYVPRLTSGSTVIGLSVITVALFNLGAPIGGVAAALCVCLWAVVFVFRGTEGGSNGRGGD